MIHSLLPISGRAIPENISSLYTIQQTPHAGLGVLASADLPPHTTLLTSSRPVAHVVFRAFRKEVCAWCFNYDCGRQWKVRYSPGGAFFCNEACFNEWFVVMGDLGRESLTVLETFILRRKRQGLDKVQETNPSPIKKPPNEDEIQQCWNSVRNQAELILAARTSPDVPNRHSKKALSAALQLLLPDDDDLLPFLVSGLISHARTPLRWTAMLKLVPHSHPYPSLSALKGTARVYIILLTILPRNLLQSVTPENIHALLARDACNSFGLWSGDTDEVLANQQKSNTAISRDGEEFLGYGVWPEASFFNHSCKPTVAKRRSGACWIFETAPDHVVQCGEELCISYLGGEEEILCLSDRRKKLKDGWHFDCMCSKCFEEITFANTYAN